MPRYLKVMLGEDVTNPITSEQLNLLINCMENFESPELVNYPIIFKPTDKGSPVMKAGFNEFDQATFIVDEEEKFTCDEDTWREVNFDNLQTYLFGIGNGRTFHLREGTCS